MEERIQNFTSTVFPFDSFKNSTLAVALCSYYRTWLFHGTPSSQANMKITCIIQFSCFEEMIPKIEQIRVQKEPAWTVPGTGLEVLTTEIIRHVILQIYHTCIQCMYTSMLYNVMCKSYSKWINYIDSMSVQGAVPGLTRLRTHLRKL